MMRKRTRYIFIEDVLFRDQRKFRLSLQLKQYFQDTKLDKIALIGRVVLICAQIWHRHTPRANIYI